MKRVKVQYAKTHLSAILAAVEDGAEYIIARGDTDIARLTPLPGPGERELGFVQYAMSPGFDDALPEDELSAWESAR